MLKIYFDSYQEGSWFQQLHKELGHAPLLPFPPQAQRDHLELVLSYDRPDIVLVDNDRPILVIERTIEVPSGHNVGQRFARLVAAAQAKVPVVYFGPYAAYKHGGATQGPRYMNLRLFEALKSMARIEGTAITTINWPVDSNYEIIQAPKKDARFREYLEMFFSLYEKMGLPKMLAEIKKSKFETEQQEEIRKFIKEKVVDAEQYDGPPTSVIINTLGNLPMLAKHNPADLDGENIILYNIGMTYICSDPYTGMAFLYAYLYCGGLKNKTHKLVLYMPNIRFSDWQKAAQSGRCRKDIKLFRLAADGILFRDQYVTRSNL